MNELQQELDRLLAELAEIDRCSDGTGHDDANMSLMTIARRGTKRAIAEVRDMMIKQMAN